ncbi:hypothetical protein GALL_215460 [mine drainage metagenome]|uniref:Fibronectin type-III domain-containing protein n=1 Tax=mine drainage metagenome TaxID=410659 RepID=A0A1J5RK27_9ZZZZ
MNYITRIHPSGERAPVNTGQYGWRRILSVAAAIAVSAVMAFAVTGCGGGGGATTATVAAPGAPTNLAVMNTTGVSLSETLTWSPPTTGGAPASYEIYRSTTAGAAFLPENHLISLPATTLTFIDNAGLANVLTYWAVSAKNAGGEVATAEKSDTPSTTTGGGGGADTGFGNNFSAALIFAVHRTFPWVT